LFFAVKWIYFSECIIGDIWETLANPVNWMWEGSQKPRKTVAQRTNKRINLKPSLQNKVYLYNVKVYDSDAVTD
jgi:hypothetical protein